MDIVPFRAEHFDRLVVQEAQAYLSRWLPSKANAKALEQTEAYTGLAGGRVVACAGILPCWEGRAVTWAYLDENAGEHMLALHRAVKRFLDNCDIKRIEATVDCEFPEGHRWARMLGFELECKRMRAYRADGGDSALYVRIR